MELSWSTFVLEIVNFLVLMWILKRFLYRPVLDLIARRRAAIESALGDARALHAEAETLQHQYEGRLAEWEQERQRAREALARTLEGERAGRLEELRGEFAREQEKLRVAEERRQEDATRRAEEAALAHGARFATRLLEAGAGPDTETRLVELAIADLAALPAERAAALREHHGTPSSGVVVASAFPLPDDQRSRLEEALRAVAPAEVPVRFEEDRELMAGTRITIGAWVLGLNLRDELRGFGALAREGRE